MREAVVVSYARTGLAKSGRGGFNITPTMSMAAHAVKHAVETRRRREGSGRGLLHGQRGARRRQPRPQRGAARRPADHHRRRHHQPLLLVGPAVDRHGRALRRRRRRRRAWWPAASSRSASRTPARARDNNDPRLTQMYPDIYMPMIDTADIVAERYKVSPRVPGRVLAGIAAPHGRRPAGRQVQGRDRPDEDQDEGGQQGDQGRDDRRLRGRPRRVQSSGHHARRPRQARAGEGSGQVHHRRQRLASSPTAPPPWC